MAKKFPFFHQLESMDCGATCLRMIARHYDRYYSLEYLRELTHMGKQGVSLLEISDAAEAIGNAGGTIRIEVTDLGPNVTLRVTDDGPGIPDDVVDHIFDPFFTTKAAGEGTGLGLAVCRKIVDAQGGSLDYQPNPEGGATFLVTLCAAAGAEDDSGEGAEPPADL